MVNVSFQCELCLKQTRTQGALGSHRYFVHKRRGENVLPLPPQYPRCMDCGKQLHYGIKNGIRRCRACYWRFQDTSVWTHSEVTELCRLYPLLKAPEVARLLERTPQSVQRKAYLLGLKADKRLPRHWGRPSTEIVA